MADDAHVRSPFVEEQVARYAARFVSEPDQVQLDLRAVTRERFGDRSVMQIGHDQAVLLEILARSMGARRAVEIGTFTGYSSLAIARGIGPEGHLLCCDVSEEWTAVARDAWVRAGVADRIELRIGPALDTLRSLPTTPHLDLVFLDADKTGYADYYREVVPRLRPGGLLIADNTLQNGRVADPAADDESAVAIRRFNELVHADPDVVSVLLPFGDGITLVQKP
jgi:caffeoyl-CoA O-methyltransferase